MDAVQKKDVPINKKVQICLKNIFLYPKYVKKTISRPFFCRQFLRKLPFFRALPQAQPERQRHFTFFTYCRGHLRIFYPFMVCCRFIKSKNCRISPLKQPFPKNGCFLGPLKRGILSSIRNFKIENRFHTQLGASCFLKC